MFPTPTWARAGGPFRCSERPSPPTGPPPKQGQSLWVQHSTLFMDSPPPKRVLRNHPQGAGGSAVITGAGIPIIRNGGNALCTGSRSSAGRAPTDAAGQRSSAEPRQQTPRPTGQDHPAERVARENEPTRVGEGVAGTAGAPDIATSSISPVVVAVNQPLVLLSICASSGGPRWAASPLRAAPAEFMFGRAVGRVHHYGGEPRRAMPGRMRVSASCDASGCGLRCISPMSREGPPGRYGLPQACLTVPSRASQYTMWLSPSWSGQETRSQLASASATVARLTMAPLFSSTT